MKAVLVTGGSGGIGSAICKTLADEGYFVWVHYHQARETAESLAKEIGGQAIGADLRTPSEITTMMETVGKLDALVNNAGIAHYGLLPDLAVNDLQDLMAINLTAAILCTKATIPAMIAAKSGVILNISSLWGEVGAACEVAYSASKAGLIGFTKALSKELAPSGIRVNAIAAGAIETNMLCNFSAAEQCAIAEGIPLGRIGKAEDIANAVAFLLSEKASYITGEILGVNGGGI